MSETTTDKLLDGRVLLTQPRQGQRASADAVMLAAAVAAKRGQNVLDLGCGTGVAMLCLAARLPGLQADGLEIQPKLVELARHNLQANAMAGHLRVFEGDLRQRIAGLQPNAYDHVLANPPYFDPARHRPAKDAGRALARQGVDGEGAAGADEAAWVSAMLRYARPSGRLWLIQRVEQLPATLAAFGQRAGGIIILPLQSKPGQPPKRLIIQAVKGGKSPLKLLPPLLLHEADGSYRPAIEAVLREGAALPEQA
ncbi:methyltransferase [Ferrovibrio sp.]|uniref:tRNA1(Val) (adenine(37)-N6)-methyltransferase n=1 Tax=Ferrovibrio sp. TaxID=1917215 RepID=UPI0025B8822D|nr:methyltransferase [Ferrovibrio sp.]MBX3453417.1 methyltransferase [Ferrovibrio sp.]